VLDNNATDTRNTILVWFDFGYYLLYTKKAIECMKKNLQFNFGCSDFSIKCIYVSSYSSKKYSKIKMEIYYFL